jgi:hypothetical protein
MSSLQFKNLEEIRNEKDCFLCQSETGKHLASSIFNLPICPLPRLNAALLLPFSLQAGRGGTSDAHDTRGAYFVVCVCMVFLAVRARLFPLRCLHSSSPHGRPKAAVKAAAAVLLLAGRTPAMSSLRHTRVASHKRPFSSSLPDLI